MPKWTFIIISNWIVFAADLTGNIHAEFEINPRLLIHANFTNKFQVQCENGTENCTDVVPEKALIPFAEGNALTPAVRTCQTEICYELAAAMRMAMNLSVDPCDNFYEYACGNWSTYNPIPDGKGSWDNFGVVCIPGLMGRKKFRLKLSGFLFSKVTEKVMRQLKEVLERDDSSDLSLARQKARTFYKACMDVDRMDTLGAWPLLQLLRSVLGDWPVLARNWDATGFHWLDAVKKSKKFGLGFFVEWASSSDPENPKKNMIHFVEASLGMNTRKLYFAPQSEYLRQAYQGLIRNLMVMLNDESGFVTPDKMAIIQADADAVYEFEVMLASLSRSEEDRRNLSMSLNKMTLEKFHSKCLSTSMTLQQLMDYMIEIMPNSTLKELVTPDMVVNVANPDYYVRLHSVLADYSRDPLKQRTMANYIGWRLTMEFAAKLTKKLREIVEAFTQAIDGSKKEPERWKICAGKVNAVMNTAVGSLYVKNYFDEMSKPKVRLLVKDLRASFAIILKKSDWMDEITRQRALDKLESMSEYIGYADYIMDDIPRLDKEYERLEFGRDHVYNSMNVNRFSVETNLKDLIKINNRSLDESLTPADVNAFYDPSNNIIAFVAGILQLPFYESSRPEYLNYAAIGAVIGHEITHAFDDQGSLFDGEGRFRDWWTLESRARYAMKASGLVQKYNNFVLPQGQVNGLLTLGENIADCGGVKTAYQAYKLYVQRRGFLEPILPGFESFTTEQLFFLGVAQDWCGSERDRMIMVQLLSASHSPKVFRIIGPLSSMPEFADSYRCRVGSRMNPVMKAAVW